VLAVQVNVTHGLPLSLADRKVAASRIIDCYPGWSNRQSRRRLVSRPALWHICASV
jgi:hypothetical protein